MAWEPDYVTSAELQSYLKDEYLDALLLAAWVTTASRAVDDYCTGHYTRQFGQVDQPEARVYAGQSLGASGYLFEIDDLQDLTGLAVADAGGSPVTGYAFGPVNAVAKGRPYEWLTAGSSGDLTITGRWGWSQVPAAVKTATLLQAARLVARRDSPFGISGSPQEQGELRLLAALDPDLRTSLKPLVRRRCVIA